MAIGGSINECAAIAREGHHRKQLRTTPEPHACGSEHTTSVRCQAHSTRFASTYLASLIFQPIGLTRLQKHCKLADAIMAPPMRLCFALLTTTTATRLVSHCMAKNVPTISCWQLVFPDDIRQTLIVRQID